ncbi:Lrp/AsnC family transcriptional regulator [Candidatus Micrarchaeota archaeon]|nr:Lrp/AsnC family transcriptional regulator [Candidatus Micrarchaeota archaeon]
MTNNAELNLKSLDRMDRFILYYLSLNSRASIRDIAKKIEKSPQFVEYRYKRLQKYINQYIPLIGYEHLGYTTVTFYLEFTGSIKYVDEIINSIKYRPEVNVIIQSQGSWDIIIGTLFKNTYDIYNGITTINKNFGQKIHSFDTLIHVGASYFGHRYLHPESKKIINKIPFTGDWTKKPINIRMTEKKNKVLRMLATDAKISYKEMSERIGCSPDNVRYMIKEMEKEKLIEGYSIILSIPTIYRIFIKLSNADEKVINKFRQYGYDTIETIQIVRTIGQYNLFYDIYVEDMKMLREWINNLRKKMGEYILDYTITNLWDTKRFTYYQIEPTILKAQSQETS